MNNPQESQDTVSTAANMRQATQNADYATYPRKNNGLAKTAAHAPGITRDRLVATTALTFKQKPWKTVVFGNNSEHALGSSRAWYVSSRAGAARITDKSWGIAIRVATKTQYVSPRRARLHKCYVTMQPASQTRRGTCRFHSAGGLADGRASRTEARRTRRWRTLPCISCSPVAAWRPARRALRAVRMQSCRMHAL